MSPAARAARALHARLLERLGLTTQAEVAEALGVHVSTYSRQLAGRVTLDLVQARAAEYGWSLTVTADGDVRIG